MTIKKLVELMKQHMPGHRHELERYIPLKLVGAGSFREVYSVRGAGWVVKFPYNTGSDREHARNEMKAIKKLLTSPKLKKYAPKVYYFEWKTGVIVMKRYRQAGYSTSCGKAGMKLSRKLIDFFETAPDFEDYLGNFARDGRRLIAVDLGLT